LPRIYISYFPEDTSHNDVKIIRKYLNKVFGAENIFDSTDLGQVETTERQQVVQSCDVLMVLIGRYWANMVDEQGNRLIEDAYDAVHVEIDIGLRSATEVFVLAVDGVIMPTRSQIPKVLLPILNKDMSQISGDHQLIELLNDLIRIWSKIPTDVPKVTDKIESTVSIDNSIIADDPLPRIFISHFPEDTSHSEVVFIRDFLRNVFDGDNILDSSGYEMNNITERQEAVQSCDVHVVIIGRNWVNLLYNQNSDWIEVNDTLLAEVMAGLQEPLVKMFVFVVNDATLPISSELPHSIQPLLRKKIFQVRDFDRLNHILNEQISLWSEIAKKMALRKRRIAQETTSKELDREARFPSTLDVEHTLDENRNPIPRVYISYFVKDTCHKKALFIRDHLSQVLGSQNIFNSSEQEVDSVNDWQHMVHSCDVLVVVIGRNWVEMLNKQSLHWVDGVNDLILAELSAGLHSLKEVIPVVVDGASIPIASELPHAIHSLPEKNIIEAVSYRQLERVLGKLVPIWSKSLIGEIQNKQKTMPQQSNTGTNHSFRPQGLTPKWDK
jgi:hypothetical protein